MDKETLKKALHSIIIAALVAFVSSFIDGLGQFIKDHASQLLNGGTGAIAYLAMSIKPK